MIVSFYDKNFKGLQDNASLVIDSDSYSLIRRGVEMDELKCTCEPFVESIQPTFLIIRNDKGNYIYGCLAGIPELSVERKTVINGTDLKSMLKSDVLLDFSTQQTVNGLLTYVFSEWDTQVNKGSFACELNFKTYSPSPYPVNFEYLTPGGGKGFYNAWEDIFSPYLKYYNLHMTTEINLIDGKVIFSIGQSMREDLNIKLWEHGLYDYGKWIASTNECQGFVYRKDIDTYIGSENCWILRSDNVITTNSANRNIYPIKRRVVVVEAADNAEQVEKMLEADTEALSLLCESLYNEDITLSGVSADFETNFKITVRRGEEIYKELPCGELHYDANGLIKTQIGYRFTGLQFLL